MSILSMSDDVSNAKRIGMVLEHQCSIDLRPSTCQDISSIKPEYQDIDGDEVIARKNGDEVNTKWQQF